ncbi:uncharacterized [Tachysurus ichikawai]
MREYVGGRQTLTMPLFQALPVHPHPQSSASPSFFPPINLCILHDSKWKGRASLTVGSANSDTCGASERRFVPAHYIVWRWRKGVEAPYLGESRHSVPTRT